ncbi:hypothetical protein [Pseudonocardia acaciae]|uniref:hypothetical protein n=1 Tax=Pseudonocardia acaciae TaxID=551276 RepID=UPI00048D6D7E|nr:hypothetical protein [Pseudonocardia acaciae]
MVDLNEPEGLSDEERVAWLRKIGTELVAETGEFTGSVEHYREGQNQPDWFVWWTEDPADTDDQDQRS